MIRSLPFDKIPFTRYGSYFAVSMDRGGNINLRDLHGGDMSPSCLYKLRFDMSDNRDVQAQMSESKLELSLGRAVCRITLGSDNTMHILVENGILRLEAVNSRYDSLIPLGPLCWEHQFYSQNIKIMLVGKGGVSAHSNWRVTESKDVSIILDGRPDAAMCVIKSYKAVPDTAPVPDFAGTANAAACEYTAWLDGKIFTDEIERMANYVLWGNFVSAEGCLHYDAMYMNKLAMGNIWSWDNCFGAIAMACTHPERAFEQFKIIFDWQDPSGALPDYVNDAFVSYSCVKPPIYGFTAGKLRERSDFFRRREIAEFLYSKIAKLTDFWLNNRMDEQLGLPCYFHGNDSGWDNASVFHAGVPLCSPDLSAYLIQQMDTLVELASELDMKKESADWKVRADELFDAMMGRLYTDGGFVSRLSPDGRVDAEAKSLLNFLPVVIWYRLPDKILDELVSTIESEFEQNYGLSTESMKSKYYKKGGYWLGPVWAPVSYIFIDTLQKAGYYKMAARLAGKFLDLPSIGGMAENFDPVTGEGYDDNAFAWTASVYLILKEEYPDKVPG